MYVSVQEQVSSIFADAAKDEHDDEDMIKAQGKVWNNIHTTCNACSKLV